MKLKPYDTPGGPGYVFQCPGCGCLHWVVPGRWMISGLEENNPTIRPSVMVRHGRSVDLSTTSQICHSFVTDGKIQFLDDCTHRLKGQTVPLPEVED